MDNSKIFCKRCKKEYFVEDNEKFLYSKKKWKALNFCDEQIFFCPNCVNLFLPYFNSAVSKFIYSKVAEDEEKKKIGAKRAKEYNSKNPEKIKEYRKKYYEQRKKKKKELEKKNRIEE